MGLRSTILVAMSGAVLLSTAPLAAAASSTSATPAAGTFATARPAVQSAGVTPDTTAINGYPTVGKFFYKVNGLGSLNCTASAINDVKGNPKRELIVTAAHCFEGVQNGIRYSTDDWLYAPMWHNNTFPYGKWSVKNVYIDNRWLTCTAGVICHENPRYDYAVVVLYPKNGHGVGYYTGQNGWRINQPRNINNTHIVGIPGNSGKALVNVTNSVTVTINPGNYLARRASTPGFGDGSSGGPWFSSLNTRSGLGTLFGVTGGYESGGSTSSPSYASYWTADFANLVAYAAARE